MTNTGTDTGKLSSEAKTSRDSASTKIDVSGLIQESIKELENSLAQISATNNRLSLARALAPILAKTSQIENLAENTKELALDKRLEVIVKVGQLYLQHGLEKLAFEQSSKCADFIKNNSAKHLEPYLLINLIIPIEISKGNKDLVKELSQKVRENTDTLSSPFLLARAYKNLIELESSAEIKEQLTLELENLLQTLHFPVNTDLAHAWLMLAETFLKSSSWQKLKQIALIGLACECTNPERDPEIELKLLNYAVVAQRNLGDYSAALDKLHTLHALKYRTSASDAKLALILTDKANILIQTGKTVDAVKVLLELVNHTHKTTSDINQTSSIRITYINLLQKLDWLAEADDHIMLAEQELRHYLPSDLLKIIDHTNDDNFEVEFCNALNQLAVHPNHPIHARLLNLYLVMRAKAENLRDNAPKDNTSFEKSYFRVFQLGNILAYQNTNYTLDNLLFLASASLHFDNPTFLGNIRQATASYSNTPEFLKFYINLQILEVNYLLKKSPSTLLEHEIDQAVKTFTDLRHLSELIQPLDKELFLNFKFCEIKVRQACYKTAHSSDTVEDIIQLSTNYVNILARCGLAETYRAAEVYISLTNFLKANSTEYPKTIENFYNRYSLIMTSLNIQNDAS